MTRKQYKSVDGNSVLTHTHMRTCALNLAEVSYSSTKSSFLGSLCLEDLDLKEPTAARREGGLTQRWIRKLPPTPSTAASSWVSQAHAHSQRVPTGPPP